MDIKCYIIDKTTADTSLPFLKVDEPPVFPGGEVEILNFIMSNTTYPRNARKKGIEGKVYLSFIVERDGSVSNAKVVRGIGGGCDEEALRVINSLPNFLPGKHQGRLVRVQFNIPINFKLSSKQ